jgi:putative peptidoglycan lipid II flippase
MAIGTVVSRGTGFVRTLALVTALGLGTRLLDAYTVANLTPNVIYDLVLGGALASVVVPLLVRADGDLFAQRLLSLVVYGLAAVVVVTIVAAPLSWISTRRASTRPSGMWQSSSPASSCHRSCSTG